MRQKSHFIQTGIKQELLFFNQEFWENKNNEQNSAVSLEKQDRLTYVISDLLFYSCLIDILENPDPVVLDATSRIIDHVFEVLNRLQHM